MWTLWNLCAQGQRIRGVDSICPAFYIADPGSPCGLNLAVQACCD
jgi:hypothetical protein